MANIDEVTAPLVILLPDGGKRLAAACFPHPLGLLYLDPFWHRQTPQESAHLLRGELRGEGPWRVGDARIRVLGCANTDPELQDAYAEWQHYLRDHSREYPPPVQVREIARRLGATPSEPDS